MTKKALVLLAEGFEEIEAITVIDVLRRGGIDVTAAGIDEMNVKGSRNIIVVTDRVLDGSEADYDIVILPGGARGAENLAASEKAAEIIKSMNNNGRIVAAICAAPAVVLAPLGILDNKFATCYPGYEEEFSSYTTFKEDPVVIDGNIITSRAPGTAFAFALTLVESLVGKKTSDKIKKGPLA